MRILIFILLPFFCIGQGSLTLQKNEYGKYFFQEIIHNNNSAETNYKRAKESIVHLYENPGWVLNYDEKDKLIVKGNFSTGRFGRVYNIHHTLVIDIKENKIRVTVTDLYITGTDITDSALETKPSFFFGESFWRDMRFAALKKIIKLHENIEFYTNKTEKDW